MRRACRCGATNDTPVCVASTCDTSTDETGATADADAPVCVLADCSGDGSGTGTADGTLPGAGNADEGSGPSQPEPPPAEQPGPDQPAAPQPPSDEPSSEQPPADEPPADEPPGEQPLPEEPSPEPRGIDQSLADLIDLLLGELSGLLPVDPSGLLAGDLPDSSAEGLVPADLTPPDVSATAIGNATRAAGALGPLAEQTVGLLGDLLTPATAAVGLRLLDGISPTIETATGSARSLVEDTPAELLPTPTTPALPSLGSPGLVLPCTCQET